MRKTILTLLSAAMLAASTVPMAAAREHHPERHAYRAPASEQFRSARDSMSRPVRPDWYSDYSEGHAISAPAGR